MQAIAARVPQAHPTRDSLGELSIFAGKVLPSHTGALLIENDFQLESCSTYKATVHR
jgi:hypothetical protein